MFQLYETCASTKLLILMNCCIEKFQKYFYVISKFIVIIELLILWKTGVDRFSFFRLISVTGVGQGSIPSLHYNDVKMGAIASQITSLAIVFSTVYSDADQIKQQSSASLAFVRGIHRRPVNSPHKWPVMRKMFPFDDVIMVVDTTLT